MEIVNSPTDLERYLRKIEKFYDLDLLSAQSIDDDYIVNYYEQSQVGYKVFHSTDGSVHMALNFDGVFDKQGYYEQANFVEEQIRANNCESVLELASGQGFNSVYLARLNPGLQFVGIDLTPAHVATAQEASEGLSNVKFSVGDFQQLAFEDESFNLIFEVESICHATNMRQALNEAHRVLRDGGEFVLFDGFRKPGFDELDPRIKLASKLTEVSMAVGQGWIIDQWKALAEEVGFQVAEVSDISEAIIPNLARFQKLARGFFKYQALGRLFSKVLPPYLIGNSIAGLLMPFTIEAQAQGYYRIILRKVA